MTPSKTANLSKNWSKTEGLLSLRNSFYYGFWLRLRKLGFAFSECHISTHKKGNVIYLVTNWRFVKGKTKVIISASRLRHRLRIKKSSVTILQQTRVCGSHLEQPFLEYFAQTDKPLFIHRLGKQNVQITTWQNYWLKHIKDNGKWTQRLKDLKILTPLMPVQTHKPRPRQRKPREG